MNDPGNKINTKSLRITSSSLVPTLLNRVGREGMSAWAKRSPDNPFAMCSSRLQAVNKSLEDYGS